MKKLKKGLVLVFSCLLLTSCQFDQISEDITNTMKLNFWSFLVQTLAFLVMVFIVIKFAYKPVVKFIEKRRDYMANELTNAKNQNLKAQNNLNKSEEILNDSRAKANDIVEHAKTEAKREQELIKEKSEQELLARRKQFEEELSMERKQAQEDIKTDIIDVAFVASETLLKREVKSQDNENLLNDFISSIDED